MSTLSCCIPSCVAVLAVALFGSPSVARALVTEDQYLKPPVDWDAKAYGYSVAIDGSTLVVGAPDEREVGGFASRGSVYVYVRDGLNWVLQQRISTPYERLDEFGQAVALHGNTLAIGAPRDPSGTSDPDDVSALGAGAVFVYVRSGTTWNLQSYVKAGNPDAEDLFGASVGLRGDTLVVGASGEDGSHGDPDDDLRTDSGAAYVFSRSGSTWTQRAYLKATNADAGDLFGFSVAFDGGTIAIGAQREDGDGSDPSDNSLAMSGAAYVFNGSGGNWTQNGYLKASNVGANDLFGTSITVKGGMIVVGAFAEDSDGDNPANNLANGSGAAYVFERTATQWTERAMLKASNPKTLDYFGYRVALGDNIVVVGAFQENSNGTDPDANTLIKSGAAYVYHRSGATWPEVAFLKASNADRFDEFGCSVAVLHRYIVVGARSEASANDDPADNSSQFRGAAYAFEGTLPDPVFAGSFD